MGWFVTAVDKDPCESAFDFSSFWFHSLISAMRQKEAALAFCPSVPSCAISIKGQCTDLAELATCEHQWAVQSEQAMSGDHRSLESKWLQGSLGVGGAHKGKLQAGFH